MACLAFATSCGGDASGCDDFNPVSEPLRRGESTTVELELIDGRWALPDIAGEYWSRSGVNVPQGLPLNGTVDGVATLVEASIALNGEIRSGSVEVEFENGEIVTFDQLIACY